MSDTSARAGVASGVAAGLAEEHEGAASSSYGLWCVDVPVARWVSALRDARDSHRLTYFDWLCGVDEVEAGVAIVAHLLDPASGVHLLVRTRLRPDRPSVGSVVGLWAGAAWHERETAEMYGVQFEGHPNPAPLLLPAAFDGHPLRKDFVLASRVARDWPGAVEPGEHAAAQRRARRAARPPGVPDPAGWGPAADRRSGPERTGPAR